jgi:hypothetical protein
MENIIFDIAKSHMERDFNAALCNLGLFVTSIDFEESSGLNIVVNISANEDVSALCPEEQ